MKQETVVWLIKSQILEKLPEDIRGNVAIAGGGERFVGVD